MCRGLKYQFGERTPTKNKNALGHLTYKDRLLLTLIRLREGISVQTMALLFGCSKSLVSDIFYVYIQVMYLQFRRLRKHMFTPRTSQPKSSLPQCFKPFLNYRVTLDTTEIKIQVPYHYRQQGNTYSKYKAGNVINYLIGSNSYGAVAFVSPGFEGRMSDPEFFQCDEGTARSWGCHSGRPGLHH